MFVNNNEISSVDFKNAYEAATRACGLENAFLDLNNTELLFLTEIDDSNQPVCGGDIFGASDDKDSMGGSSEPSMPPSVSGDPLNSSQPPSSANATTISP